MLPASISDFPREVLCHCFDFVVAPYSISACEEQSLLPIPPEELRGLAGKVSSLALTCTAFYESCCEPLSSIKRVYMDEHGRILFAVFVEGNKEYTESLQKVIDTFGAKEKIRSYPILDIGDYDNDYLNLDFKFPEIFKEKTQPIGMGRDVKGRLFFAMLICDSANENKKCIATFFQKHVPTFRSPMWCSTPANLQKLCGTPMYPRHWDNVTLVLQGQHPRYQLLDLAPPTDTH